MNERRRRVTCRECLFHQEHPEESRENCLRFARFVDHALTEATRDCDYWTPREKSRGE